MARPPLALGTYGKIGTWRDGDGYIARTQFRDFDGVVRKVKRAGRSAAAAERALKAALVERQAPTQNATITPDSKFGRVAELWLVEFESAVDMGQRSPGSLSTYQSIYRRHVAPALEALRVREVTTPVVDRMLVVINKKSTSEARTAKIVVSNVMRLAARHGAVRSNPVREVGQIESQPKNLPRALTAEEREQWLDAVRANPKALLWDLPDLSLMMLATGCRIGEGLAFGWEDIDLDEATADIRWRLVRRTGVGLLRMPSTKTGRKGERLVPLPSWGVEMLKARRELIGAGVEPVFPDSLGGWRDPSNVRRVWRNVRDEAEMTGLVSHHMRKTVASFLDDADVSTRRISDQLGHASVSMTQDNYLGRRLTDRVTSDVLEGMFADSPNGKRSQKGPKASKMEPGQSNESEADQP